MVSQAAPPELDIVSIAVWVVVLIAAAVLLAVVIVAVKRWTFRDEESAETTWTLHDLTALRDSGELTIPQYERLRADLIRKVKEPVTDVEKGRNESADGLETGSKGESVA